MATPPLTFHKVLEMPDAPVADGMYFIRKDGVVQLVVTGTDATVYSALAPVQMVFSSAGKPAAGAEFGRYRVAQAVLLDQILSGAVAAAGATDAVSIDVMRGADLAARFSWAAGASVATVSIFMPTVAKGDVLIFKTPAVQDATLSGIAGTLVGRHN